MAEAGHRHRGTDTAPGAEERLESSVRRWERTTRGSSPAVVEAMRILAVLKPR
ncbi:hypothetical protein [Streptomyces sp. NPDC058664]|uniref:hypothetical protein n=1 Tax=unclassified Streptomyces TaxID=2593676 RepID=UPI003646B1D7